VIPLSAKDVNTAYCAVLNANLSEVMTVEVKSSMKTVRVFSVALVAIFLAVGLLFETDATSTGDAVLVDVAPKVSQEEIDRQREAAAKRSEEESRIREQYLGSEEDIQYYAYLNLSTAAEELKPIVLAARNIIIYRYSWVADGLNGQILDKNGNIKRKVPEFSELFPEDWELPVSPAKDVDLSYYAISDE